MCEKKLIWKNRQNNQPAILQKDQFHARLVVVIFFPGFFQRFPTLPDNYRQQRQCTNRICPPPAEQIKQSDSQQQCQ